MQPLITERWRRPVLAAVGIAVLLVALLSVMAFHSHSTAFDDRVAVWAVRHVDETERQQLIHLTEPWLSIGLLVLIGVVALLARRWTLVALTVVGPVLAIGLTEGVLKPIIARVLGPFALADGSSLSLTGSFPSGHETGVTSAALVLLVATGQLPWRGWARALLAVVLAAWAFVAAIALIRSFYHYATDTIGALGVSTAVVLAGALALDRFAARLPARGEAARVS